MKTEYRVVVGLDPRELCEQVNALLAEAWQLAGPLAITMDHGCVYHAQPMTLKTGKIPSFGPR